MTSLEYQNSVLCVKCNTPNFIYLRENLRGKADNPSQGELKQNLRFQRIRDKRETFILGYPYFKL